MMRKMFCVLAAVLLLPGICHAVIGVYEQTIDIYEYSIGGIIDFQHTYDHSADPIDTAILTIVADDVDLGEDDEVWVKDLGGTWNSLGLLEDMGIYTDWAYHPGPGNPSQPLTTTEFALDPAWINGLPVEVRIESAWGVEIETSTLTITAVPEPGTVLLLGLGGLSLWRKRRAIK